MNCLSSTEQYFPQIRAGVLAAVEGLVEKKPKKTQGRDITGVEAAYPGLQEPQNLGRI